MPKRKKRKKKKLKDIEEKKSFKISKSVKRAIWVVVFFAIALVFFLSLLGYAGTLGQYLDKGARPLFGWGVWVFPFMLILVSFFLASSKEQAYQVIKISATCFFVLIYSALLNLKIPLGQMVYYAKSGQGGGYAGLALAYPLIKSTGFWVSLIILSALGVIALLLMFETKLFKIGKAIIWMIYQMPFGGLFAGFKEKLQKKLQRDPVYIRDVGDDEDMEEEKKTRKKLKLSFGKGKKNKEKEIDVSEEESFLSEEKKEERELSRSLKSKYRRQIDIPLSLLKTRGDEPSAGDIKANKEKIQKALENFGINVEMGDTYTGPTVTQYTFKPQEGVRLSRITALHNDLALALAAHPIRIEAPIPRKSLVGVEVPNKVIATVGLRAVLKSKKFRKKRKSNLTLGIGRDVAGNSYITDLKRMPHLLIAGATGSGKSVCINVCIISLLFQNSPDDLKFILVDPKRVELNVYNGIPHLLTPVITDAKKTINALKWAVDEMDRRYDVLSEVGARNIENYNSRRSSHLPYIVIVIDELADLMSIASKEVEALVVRLAQMARAVGIHLVLATQRPSVNVITGLIKANITARIAFAVASQTDSRTILDSSGAEKMLGRGDMLFVTAELSKPKRLQGAYVDDKEIKAIASFLREASEPDYLEEVTEKQVGFTMPIAAGGGMIVDRNSDELLGEARDLIIRTGKASASYLQRHLRIGYARAARILDLLESEGTIGPGDGAKAREVLVKPDQDAVPEEIGEEG